MVAFMLKQHFDITADGGEVNWEVEFLTNASLFLHTSSYSDIIVTTAVKYVWSSISLWYERVK